MAEEASLDSWARTTSSVVALGATPSTQPISQEVTLGPGESKHQDSQTFGGLTAPGWGA